MTTSATATQTFTLTHAKYLTSKVVSDMYQCSRLYGSPSTDQIANYEQELVVMLAGGYVSEYEFGFKRAGARVVSWQYHVDSSGTLVGGADDRSGGIYGRADTTGSVSFNFMSYSSTWFGLSASARDAVRAQHPISRGTGTLPGDGAGYWQVDRNYSSAGVGIGRKTFRPL